MYETNTPDFTLSEPVVTVSVSPQAQGSKVIDCLNSFSANDVFGKIKWKFSDTPRASCFHVILDDGGEETSEKVSSYVVRAASPSEVPFSIADLSAKGKICLPTGQGMQDFMSRVKAFSDSWKKLKQAKQLKLMPYEKPIYIDDDMNCGVAPREHLINAKIYAIFPKDVADCIPEAKKILDSRFRRTLQRDKPAWHPFETRVDPECSVYSHALHSSEEHLEKRKKIREDVLAETGVSLSSADMKKAQQGIGITFLGGHNRATQGFTPPTSVYKRMARKVCELTLRGLAESYILDPEGFHDLTTRAKLKPHSFQGSATWSYNFIDHLMMLRMMALHPDGLFMFDNDDYEFPTVVGFRSQDPGGKWVDGKFIPKCRVSYMINGVCEVMRTHVLDGALLNHVTNFPDADLKVPPGYNVYLSPADLFADEAGARIRHVTNPPIVYNDGTIPVPSFISDHKTAEYKQIMGQKEEVMRAIVPKSDEFEDFWLTGYEEQEWVRHFAEVNHGITDGSSLVAAMREEGERMYAGDVVNFDGNTDEPLIRDSMDGLVSRSVMSLSSRILNAPILGTTSTPCSTQLYYIVDRADEATAKVASHLPSGWGCTSQAGRTIVPAAINEMVYNAFKDFGVDEELLFKPARPGSCFSFQAALYNCAGDDHVVKMLVLWLVTGLSVDKCHELYNKEVESYTTIKMAEEDPPMCAGWYFHLDDKKRVQGLSLSLNRLSINTLTPEYPRTAIGLDASTRQYVESAVGTPFEDKMVYLRNKIVNEVYDLTDEELAEGVEEDIVEIERNLANGADPRELIAELLGVTPSKVDYDFTVEELIDAGIDESLLESYTLPIPPILTKDPARFLNMDTIKKVAKEYPWSIDELKASRKPKPELVVYNSNDRVIDVPLL